jgi:hypothetical protein
MEHENSLLLSLNPVLSQMNSVYILTPYCFKIHFNIILFYS